MGQVFFIPKFTKFLRPPPSRKRAIFTGREMLSDRWEKRSSQVETKGESVPHQLSKTASVSVGAVYIVSHNPSIRCSAGGGVVEEVQALRPALVKR